MPEIVPAIIAKDFEELEKKIKLVEPYVSWVQLDVMDGKFAPEKSWDNPAELKNISTSLNLEVHLMVSEPEKEIDAWINSGVKKILIHIESTKNLQEIIKKIKGAGLKAGVVLNLETDVTKIEPFADSVDLVQFMAIAQIGYHGHPFDDKVIPKIIALRQKYPNVKIAVDGGINSETAQKAAQAGADILVAGSAVFESKKIEQTVTELKQAVELKMYKKFANVFIISGIIIAVGNFIAGLSFGWRYLSTCYLCLSPNPLYIFLYIIAAILIFVGLLRGIRR